MPPSDSGQRSSTFKSISPDPGPTGSSREWHAGRTRGGGGVTTFAEVEFKGCRGQVAFDSEEAFEHLIAGGAFSTFCDSAGTVWAAPHEPLYSWDHLDPVSEAYEAKDWGRFASAVEAGEHDLDDDADGYSDIGFVYGTADD